MAPFRKWLQWASTFWPLARGLDTVRKRRNRRLISASGLFYSDWYLEQNPDVRRSGLDPIIHYLERGAASGRDPNPVFDGDWYLAENPGVRAARQNPLVHYLRHGAAEGRDPSVLFDTARYLRQRPDLGRAGGNPLIHYLRYGATEGLDPNSLFDSDWYLQQNPDVARSGLNPLIHYMWRGAAKGCDPSPKFSNTKYLEHNPDIAEAGLNPLKEGLKNRSCAVTFLGRARGGDVDTVLPVPLLQATSLRDCVAKVIAFYLPQFHPIPENDAWWGRGFTEWTKVVQAVPRFVGHYQPHLPGELGFYDLRIPEVQRRQVELAKLYGIGGFCFYFYWFGGRRLLEMPLLQYLEHPEFELPFCLCWANENWTRRWDGLEDDVLIGQNYSPEDDVSFISYISRYLKDPRYIRIDEKPVIVVYRPGLLPQMRETAARWRDWCRANGISEIFIAYVQSFDTFDPREYGFDAAIEFPPMGNPPPRLWEGIEFLDDEYRGRLFDWRDLVQQSSSYHAPAYLLFRGVCPGWDNEARRPGQSSVLYGSSPEGYLKWLENAVADSVSRFANANARLVFVNAWNEWAEGAYLEPDRKYGYAYLEATRMALLRTGLRAADRDDRRRSSSAAARLGIVIHAFYPDIFENLATRLDRLECTFKVFVSAPTKAIDALRSILKTKTFSHELVQVENRGRDVAPFLRGARKAIDDGFDIILKLHTKKSSPASHSEKWGSADEWREGLYRCLADPAQIEWIVSQMRAHHDIGIAAADPYLVPLARYWGQNQPRVEWLARRMGIDAIDPVKDVFPAGTMFFARALALEPLLNIALNLDDFEPEEGQRDGTMAHAIERVIAYSARAAGLTVTSARTTDLESEQVLVRVG